MQETILIEQPVGAVLSPVPAPAPTMTLCSYGTKLTREELARVATAAATATHKPIPHIAVVDKLIEALLDFGAAHPLSQFLRCKSTQ